MGEEQDSFEALYRFYENKDIAGATACLRSVLQNEEMQTAPMIYSFGRIASLYEEAYSQFSDLQPEFADNEFLNYLFAQLNEGSYEEPVQEISTDPIILDVVWSEFFITGDMQPLKQIVSVLDWPDIVRQKLDAWVKARDPKLALGDTETLLHDCMFPIDFEKQIINEPVDLDIHVALCARAGELKFAQLPIDLSENELIHLAMKSAAIWSLTSNSRTHQIVAEFCKAETEGSGAARRHLV